MVPENLFFSLLSSGPTVVLRRPADSRHTLVQGKVKAADERRFFFLSLSLSSGSGYCGAAALDAAVSICFLVAFFCIRPHGIAIPLCDLRRVPQHLTLLAQNSILFFWK